MLKNINKNILILLPFFLIETILIWSVSSNIFFWDTVQLGAKHASFYYENNFKIFLLPNNIDSGHIPAFGMYLAACWKIFGKNLVVSHFSILPFLFGIIWQSFLLLKKFISSKYTIFALAIFLLDPTLLGQSILVSPDIPLVFLFLLGINAVLNNKKLLIGTASVGLTLISMRGMMVAFSLFLIDFILNVDFKKKETILKKVVTKLLVYIPSLLIFLFFNIYHYSLKGWIGYHEDSPWAECFQKTNFSEIIYNIGILGWRLLDFGRVFLWITSTSISIIFLKKIIKDQKAKQLAIMFALVLLCLSISFIFYKNLSGHRYILPAILLFTLISIYLIFEILKRDRIKYILWGILTIGLLCGNFWVYPEDIAQGWDSSLAHLPYYKLRTKMENFIKEEHIPSEKVASFFPNISELKYLELTESSSKHPEFHPGKSEYLIYSNIYNISDKDRNSISKNYILVKEYRKHLIYIRLYKLNKALLQ